MTLIKLKQAVILCGGIGTRLRPLTNNCPKPMVLANGRPFVTYLIDLLKKNNIKEVILLLGYLPKKFRVYFGDGSKFGISIKYSVSNIDDETGIRLKKAVNLLDDHFFLLYGDNYWPFSLKKMINFYKSKGVFATTTVYNNKDGYGEYGYENNICVGKNGRVLFYDKTRQNSRLNGVDIGFFILNKKIVLDMPNHNFSFEKEIIPSLINKKQIAAYQTDDRYHTITNALCLKNFENYIKL